MEYQSFYPSFFILFPHILEDGIYCMAAKRDFGTLISIEMLSSNLFGFIFQKKELKSFSFDLIQTNFGYIILSLIRIMKMFISFSFFLEHRTMWRVKVVTSFGIDENLHKNLRSLFICLWNKKLCIIKWKLNLLIGIPCA